MASQVKCVKHFIKSLIIQLKQFEDEYAPESKMYNKNLVITLNDLERNVYALEKLYDDREKVNIYLDSIFDLDRDLFGFLKERVMENNHIFVFLAFYFEVAIDDLE